jgi:hypothetical protein
MTNPPCERVQHRNTDEHEIQGIPRENRETSRDNRETSREYTGRTGSVSQALRSESQRGCPARSAGFEPPPGMEIAGTAAVTAPPPGPGQDQPGTTGSRPDQASQHMTHFRHRQRKQRPGRGSSAPSSWGQSRGSQGKRLDTDAGQKGLRQHHQGDMAIPAQIAAHLVVVQAQVFGVFEIFVG